MEKDIQRRWTLTGDDLRAAVWHWLKTVHDQPVPPKDDMMTLADEHGPDIGDCVAEWRERATYPSSKE